MSKILAAIGILSCIFGISFISNQDMNSSDFRDLQSSTLVNNKRGGCSCSVENQPTGLIPANPKEYQLIPEVKESDLVPSVENQPTGLTPANPKEYQLIPEVKETDLAPSKL